MASKNEFSKKIQELTWEEFDYTDDFFRDGKAQRDPQDRAVSHLRAAALQGPRQSLSTEYADHHIDEMWLQQEEEQPQYEGQMAVDVFETPDHLVITSTVAGVRADDLDVSINGDMITIKGIRRPIFEEVEDEHYYTRECYWGGFSRSIILPSEVLRNEIEATLEHGVLTIRLPKVDDDGNGKIQVVDISER